MLSAGTDIEKTRELACFIPGQGRAPGAVASRYAEQVKTAVIDIGTNTLLLLIVDEKLNRVVDLCRFGRLGKGLDASGRLADEAIAKSLDICREYRAVMTEHEIAKPHVIGTQALREAANARDFVGPAEQILGAPIEIIAGPREAELAYLSVARTFPDLDGESFVVVDVGGGSTELIIANDGGVVSAVSVPIGAVRLTERYLESDPPAIGEVLRLDDKVDRVLAPLNLPAGIPVIGTAGTATTMAAVSLGLTTYDPDKVTGHRLSPEDIDQLRQRMFSASTAQRRDMPGIEPQRADVIAAGVAIYHRVMHRMGAPVLITCDRGIRWGLAYELVS
jgi:exopolyphosphatase / guanosine-5'-triphosphate,3'-diphosphate pyrophosphatase